MLSNQILAPHYAEYAAQSDEWVANMEVTKRSIVENVLKTCGFKTEKDCLRIVVLGASDKRYLPIHERVFAVATHKQVEMVTFDLDPAHLGGISAKVMQHDVTKLFPAVPYDIVFSHELMKFLTPEEQLQTIVNSYQALAPGGIAMHIIHEPSIKGTQELRSWQYRVSPDELLVQLRDNSISAQKLVFESDSHIDWLRETTVLMLRKN